MNFFSPFHGRFTLFSSKFPSNIYSILYGKKVDEKVKSEQRGSSWHP